MTTPEITEIIESVIEALQSKKTKASRKITFILTTVLMLIEELD